MGRQSPRSPLGNVSPRPSLSLSRWSLVWHGLALVIGCGRGSIPGTVGRCALGRVGSGGQRRPGGRKELRSRGYSWRWGREARRVGGAAFPPIRVTPGSARCSVWGWTLRRSVLEGAVDSLSASAPFWDEEPGRKVLTQPCAFSSQASRPRSVGYRVGFR